MIEKHKLPRKLYAIYITARLVHYLEGKGYIGSQLKEKSISKNGDPIPWLPYAVINILEERLCKNMDVFEYGSGSSTMWFSKRVHSITSCEHDLDFYNKVKNELPKNVKYIYAGAGDIEYSKAIDINNSRYDIVIIDGIERVNCAKNCVSHLKDNGVVIFDNTDRGNYKEGIEYLLDCGFKTLSVEDLVALQTVSNRTTIFYKNGNCLGI